MTETDPLVRAALAHWGPRMIANGIDYNDFQATLARVARWPQWCAQWMATARRHETLAREAQARDSALSAAEAHARAAICYHFGKFVFFEDMEQYRQASAATPAAYGKALALLDPPAERVAVAYAGTTLAGYLRRPAGVAQPPVVLIISGLDSVKEEMHTLEPLFHRRGMATLSFDGPGQGEGEVLPIEPAYETVVAAAIDWLQRRDDVDARRIGAVGVSLGGYYAARAAAYERRLKGVATVSGPYDWGATLPNMPPLSQQAFRHRSQAPDLQTALEMAKRLTLRDAAREIAVPLLVIAGRKDRLIAPEQAERLFAETPIKDKHLQMYEDGTHVCNNVPFAWRPLAADWLGTRLRARPPQPAKSP